MKLNFLLIIMILLVFGFPYGSLKTFIPSRGCGISVPITKMKSIPAKLDAPPKCTEVENVGYSWQHWTWAGCTGQCGTPGTMVGTRKCINSDGGEVEPSKCVMIYGGVATHSQLCQIENCSTLASSTKDDITSTEASNTDLPSTGSSTTDFPPTETPAA